MMTGTKPVVNRGRETSAAGVRLTGRKLFCIVGYQHRRVDMSFGEDAGTNFATARGRDWPSVRQFNVLLANRVGAMVNVLRCFENTDVRIVSISIINTADCAIFRLVVSDPERATEIFERAGL